MNRNNLLILVIIGYFLSSFFVKGQTNIKAFYIGHSLSDQIPEMVKSLADEHQNVSFNDWRYQSIPGSPLRFNWDARTRNDYTPNPDNIYGYYHPTQGLPAGNFDVFVMTESVPRINTPLSINDTHAYADSFYVYAKNYNPAIQIYLYEVWHCINSGTPTACSYDINSNPWRQRLSDDLPMWESVVNRLNQNHSSTKPVKLIPAGQALARLYDEILAGNVPGITSINQLFSDDIHLTEQGKYFIACVHFATLYKTSPLGLSNQLKNRWGGDFAAPTPAQALKFQEIAVKSVQEYLNLSANTTIITPCGPMEIPELR